MLLEPLTVVEKGLNRACRLQRRLRWRPRRVLVLGAGPIGLLGAALTRALGLETTLWSRRIGDSRRAWLDRIGAGAVPSARRPWRSWRRGSGAPDLVLECPGAPPVIRDALLSLGANGVLCLLGVSAGEGPVEVPVARWNLQAVLGNQVVFGCVNAHRRDFEAGARHMAGWARRWPGLLEALVTRQVPPEHFEAAVARRRTTSRRSSASPSRRPVMDEWIDVTVPIHPGMVVYEGDPPVEVTAVLSLERGDPANVSRLALGSHTGAHLDAPCHVVPGGAGVDRLPLEVCSGPRASWRVHRVRSGRRPSGGRPAAASGSS